MMLGQSQHRESIPYPRLLRRAIEFPLQYTDRDLLLLGGAFHWPISTHNPSLFDLPLTHTDPVGAAG